MLPMRPELLKGHLDALLLAVVEDGPQPGYAVIEALRSDSGGALDLPTGTSGSGLGQIETSVFVSMTILIDSVTKYCVATLLVLC